MNGSAKGVTLAITLGVMAGLLVTMSTNVAAQTELKISEDAFPTLKPVPKPSFPELQPGTSDSRYAACNNAVVPFNSGSQKVLQVYIDITSRRARCIEADTAGSEALYDRSLVDLYQQKYAELSAVLVASQEILDREKSISTKQLIDYSGYVNEEITLLMVLSAYAECKALEANSLAMKVDPKCDTDRLQEIIATREQSGLAQRAHTQSLFKDFELNPFRKLSAIATPQELITLVTGRGYRPIGAGPKRQFNSAEAPRVQERAEPSAPVDPGKSDLPGPCARLVALMGNADYWREQADALDGEAAMARDAARGWRVISLSAREGAEYARKSGIASSERFLQDKAEELETRAQEYEVKAKNKENQAKLLRENADAEDEARLKHQANWCVRYQSSPETAFAPESVKIDFEPSLSYKQQEAIDDREDGDFTEYGVMHIDQEAYTADDIKQFLDRWQSSQFTNDPRIIRAGQGLGRDLMVLADFRPDLALLLLNELSKLDAEDLESILELVKLIREKAQDPEKIAEVYSKSFNDYWMAKLTHVVERMQETIEIQISVTQPATVTSEPGSATREAAKDCPRFTLDTSADTEYWRSLADIADAEAISARETAKSWRDIARQAADGAAQAGEDGNTSSQKFQNAKAEELNQRANDLDARAAEKENEAADLRRKAEAEDEKRCEERRNDSRTATTIPAPQSTAQVPKQPDKVCGPDVSTFVMRVLNKIQQDWNSWGYIKKFNRCAQLINPVTGGRAWDIRYLDPSRALPDQEKFEKRKEHDNRKPIEDRELTEIDTLAEYIQKGRFYFEDQKQICAKPRDPCIASVMFFGQCMHAQQVNYVQWGAMSKLCNQKLLPDLVHRARNNYNETYAHITASQRIAVGMGESYMEAAEYYRVQQTSDPGAAQQQLISHMTARMKSLIADPKHAAFAKRDEAACTKKCPLVGTVDNLRIDYKWGAGGLEDLQ